MSDGQRNIVLLTYDSLRADHCGYMGYERDTTPNLDRLADEGVAFENATSVAPRTNPSMAATFTGEPMTFREPVSNPEVANYHLERFDTLAEELSEMGYTTGAFNPNAYASRYYGFDRGFDDFEDFLFSESRYQTIFEEQLDDSGLYGWVRNIRNLIKREEVFRTWDQYVDDIETWTDEQDGPYFLWVFSLDTHFPFLAPWSDRQFSSIFDQYYYNWKSNQVIDDLEPNLSNRTWQKMIDIYDESIRFADRLIGELQERLVDDDPVLVVHSDHGEAFGEHGMFGHFYPLLYEENVHVPTVAWSSDTEGERISEPFSLLDLPEYIVDKCTQGNLSNPPTHKAAIMSDYDGRRERNVIATRAERDKYILEISNSSEKEKYMGINTKEYQLETEIPMEEAPDVLRQLATRRKQHEDEILGIRQASKGL